MSGSPDNPLLREQRFLADAGDAAVARLLERESRLPKLPDPRPYVKLPPRGLGIEVGLKGTF